MNAQVLAAVAGFFLSLLFSYVPGFRSWFDGLDVSHGQEKGGNYKRLIMAGLIVLVAGVSFGLSCAGWLDKFAPDLALACTEDGAADLIMAVVLALAANQGAYALTPKRQTS